MEKQTVTNGNGTRFTNSWTAAISAASLMTIIIGGVGSFAISTVAGSVGTNRDDLNRLRSTYLSIREHEQYKEGINQQFKLLRDEQTRLRNRSANKEGTKNQFAALNERISDVTMQVKELRDSLSSSSSLKDVIANLQKQLDDLRAKVLAPSK